MKKTITITLNSILFNIEEDAYNKLNKYLESIKEHYGSPDREEILADIESSISKKFSTKINSKKESINLKNVEEVIKILGTIDEFTAEEKTDKPKTKRKRLYRNPDDSIIGGVSSGIATYFGLDPILIRLIFLLSLIFKGVGFFIYVIFWIILPKADTNTQKLEMKGKPVNLKKIEQAVKEKSKKIKKESQAIINNNRGLLSKILLFPIKVVEVTFIVVKKILSKLGPAISIFIGIIIIISIIISILAITMSAGVLIFNINSPYLKLDVPIQEFTHLTTYYSSVIAAYLITVIPLFFILLFGITMINRKNAFKAIISGSLITIWMLAIITIGITAVDLVPQIKEKMDETSKINTVTQEYEFSDFENLHIYGEKKTVNIIKGDEFSVTITGEKDYLSMVDIRIEDDRLKISEKKKGWDGMICIICIEKNPTINITMPELKSFKTHGRVTTNIGDFTNDMTINVGESAKVIADIKDNTLSSYIAGTNGRLELTNSPKIINVTLEGVGRFTALKLDTESISINPNIYSKVNLAGQTEKLTAELNNLSKLYSFDLKAQKVAVKTSGHSKAEVNPELVLEAIALDNSTIIYKGTPENIIKKNTDKGIIKMIENFDLEGLNN